MLHPQPLKAFKILILDDAQPPRKMLRRLLNVFGEYEYDEVEDVSKAKKLTLVKNDFTLIMSDVKIPGGSGVDFLRWIRSGEAGDRLKNVPFICFSSDFESKDIDNARALGASGFLNKPFSFGDVYQVLSATFNWGQDIRKYFDQKIGAE